MSIAEGPSRSALVPAVDSTTKVVTPNNLTTIWNYRKGYVATTSPSVGNAIAFGFACFGAAALIREVRLLGTSRRWR
jgi:hypothetical protein